MLLRSRRLAVAWLALLAVLMATLAPALSHATGASAPAGWMAICSANGNVLFVDADGVQQPAPDDAAPTLLEHCPYCALQVAAFPVPHPAPGVVPAPALPALEAPAYLHAGRTLEAWVRAQPRGPPAGA